MPAVLLKDRLPSEVGDSDEYNRIQMRRAVLTRGDPTAWCRNSGSPKVCRPTRGAAFRQLVVPEYGGVAMLVLSRKKQESVMVGGCSGFERLLKVTVLEIRAGSVRLGFDANADLPVHRAEVWERIFAESQTPPSQQEVERPRARRQMVI